MKRLAALGAFKLSYFLKNRVDAAFFSRYSRLICADVTREELFSYPEEPGELFRDSPVCAARYQMLYDHCGGDRIALTAIQLYLLSLMEERTLGLLREGMGMEHGLTIEAAGRIANPGKESIEEIPELRRAFDRVELLLQAEPGGDYLKAHFRLDGRIAAFLRGDDQLHRPLAEWCSVISPHPAPPPACLTEQAVREVSGVLARQSGFSVIHISGERGSGRRFFARHVAAQHGLELLLVPFHAVCEGDRMNRLSWRQVLRELALSKRALCLCDVGFERQERGFSYKSRGLLSVLERDLERFGRPVFVTTGPEVKLLAFLECFVMTVNIPSPTISQGMELWRMFAREYLKGPEGLPVAELASRMTLSAGQIRRIVRLLAGQKPEGPWESREIFRLCYQLLDDGRYQNVKFVDAFFGWEDLKLAPELKKVLQEVCSQVEHQGTVLDEWGLRRKYPYGRSVSVLFSGPPGTGKTMAAQVLASMLGLGLYKVDLSQSVDKYIGETEKRLKQVFDQAAKSNLILFFDEADALLGKRSEVKDSKDKYANTEVAYLLQRMEEYQGVAIMATNQAGNMDPAFLRRFRYHMVFPMPDEGLRRQIWEDSLSGVPAGQVDYGYLARQFELSGAQIKNIVLNAAYRAAGDGGTLGMEHLVHAIAQEQQKSGKVVFADEYGEYGFFLAGR